MGTKSLDEGNCSSLCPRRGIRIESFGLGEEGGEPSGVSALATWRSRAAGWLPDGS
jgi:hypothetical protein